jgi:hypothetical protein
MYDRVKARPRGDLADENEKKSKKKKRNKRRLQKRRRKHRKQLKAEMETSETKKAENVSIENSSNDEVNSSDDESSSLDSSDDSSNDSNSSESNSISGDSSDSNDSSDSSSSNSNSRSSSRTGSKLDQSSDSSASQKSKHDDNNSRSSKKLKKKKIKSRTLIDSENEDLAATAGKKSEKMVVSVKSEEKIKPSEENAKTVQLKKNEPTNVNLKRRKSSDDDETSTTNKKANVEKENVSKKVSQSEIRKRQRSNDSLFDSEETECPNQISNEQPNVVLSTQPKEQSQNSIPKPLPLSQQSQHIQINQLKRSRTDSTASSSSTNSNCTNISLNSSKTNNSGVDTVDVKKRKTENEHEEHNNLNKSKPANNNSNNNNCNNSNKVSNVSLSAKAKSDISKAEASNSHTETKSTNKNTKTNIPSTSTISKQTNSIVSSKSNSSNIKKPLNKINEENGNSKDNKVAPAIANKKVSNIIESTSKVKTNTLKSTTKQQISLEKNSAKSALSSSSSSSIGGGIDDEPLTLSNIIKSESKNMQNNLKNKKKMLEHQTNEEDEHEVDQVVKSIFAATNKSAISSATTDNEVDSTETISKVSSVDQEQELEKMNSQIESELKSNIKSLDIELECKENIMKDFESKNSYENEKNCEKSSTSPIDEIKSEQLEPKLEMLEFEDTKSEKTLFNEDDEIDSDEKLETLNKLQNFTTNCQNSVSSSNLPMNENKNIFENSFEIKSQLLSNPVTPKTSDQKDEIEENIEISHDQNVFKDTRENEISESDEKKSLTNGETNDTESELKTESMQVETEELTTKSSEDISPIESSLALESRIEEKMNESLNDLSNKSLTEETTKDEETVLEEKNKPEVESSTEIEVEREEKQTTSLVIETTNESETSSIKTHFNDETKVESTVELNDLIKSSNETIQADPQSKSDELISEVQEESVLNSKSEITTEAEIKEPLDENKFENALFDTTAHNLAQQQAHIIIPSSSNHSLSSLSPTLSVLNSQQTSSAISFNPTSMDLNSAMSLTLSLNKLNNNNLNNDCPQHVDDIIDQVACGNFSPTKNQQNKQNYILNSNNFPDSKLNNLLNAIETIDEFPKKPALPILTEIVNELGGSSFNASTEQDQSQENKSQLLENSSHQQYEEKKDKLENFDLRSKNYGNIDMLVETALAEQPVSNSHALEVKNETKPSFQESIVSSDIKFPSIIAPSVGDFYSEESNEAKINFESVPSNSPKLETFKVHESTEIVNIRRPSISTQSVFTANSNTVINDEKNNSNYPLQLANFNQFEQKIENREQFNNQDQTQRLNEKDEIPTEMIVQKIEKKTNHNRQNRISNNNNFSNQQTIPNFIPEIQQQQTSQRKKVTTPQPSNTTPPLSNQRESPISSKPNLSQQQSISPSNKMLGLNDSVTKIILEQLATSQNNFHTGMTAPFSGQTLSNSIFNPTSTAKSSNKANSTMNSNISDMFNSNNNNNNNHHQQAQVQQHQSYLKQKELTENLNSNVNYTQYQNPFTSQENKNSSITNQFLPPMLPSLNSLEASRTWQDAYAKYPLPFLTPPQFQQNSQQPQQQQQQQQQISKTQQHQHQRHQTPSPSPSPSPKNSAKQQPQQQTNRTIGINSTSQLPPPNPQSVLSDANFLMASLNNYGQSNPNNQPFEYYLERLKYENNMPNQQIAKQAPPPTSSSVSQLQTINPSQSSNSFSKLTTTSQTPQSSNQISQQQQQKFSNKSKKQLAKEYELQQQQQQVQQNQFQNPQSVSTAPQYSYSPFLLGAEKLPQFLIGAALQQQHQQQQQQVQVPSHLTFDPQIPLHLQQQQQQIKNQNYPPSIDYMSQMMNSFNVQQPQINQYIPSLNQYLNIKQQQEQQQHQPLQNQPLLNYQNSSDFKPVRSNSQNETETEAANFITGFTEFQEPKNVIWTGSFTIKNDTAQIAMNFVNGNFEIANKCLIQMKHDSRQAPLRILQRMRLEQSQLEGVQRKLQLENEHCILLAVPFGNSVPEQMTQTSNLKNGFINYLFDKRAAGIVNVAIPNVSDYFFLLSFYIYLKKYLIISKYFLDCILCCSYISTM